MVDLVLSPFPVKYTSSPYSPFFSAAFVFTPITRPPYAFLFFELAQFFFFFPLHAERFMTFFFAY